MIWRSRAIAEALHGIRSQLVALTKAIQLVATQEAPDEGATDRIEALELSRAVWEAEMEGLVLKAKNQYKASAASESRARTQRRHDEDIFDDGPPEGPAPVEEPEVTWVPPGNDLTSEGELLQTMRESVVEDGKGSAEAMKWGTH